MTSVGMMEELISQRDKRNSSIHSTHKLVEPVLPPTPTFVWNGGLSQHSLRGQRDWAHDLAAPVCILDEPVAKIVACEVSRLVWLKETEQTNEMLRMRAVFSPG